MEKNVTILLLLALAAAPQPLGAQATGRPRRPRRKRNPRTAAPSQAGVCHSRTRGRVRADAHVGDATAVNPNSYKIGLNDEVKITVFDEPDLSTMYRVDADGSISFPLIGRVTAAGTTLVRAAAADYDDVGGRLHQEPAGPG